MKRISAETETVNTRAHRKPGSIRGSPPDGLDASGRPPTQHPPRPGVKSQRKSSRIWIQIGRARRQAHSFYTRLLQRDPERLGELRVAIHQQVLLATKKTLFGIGDIPGNLQHPIFVRIRAETCEMYSETWTPNIPCIIGGCPYSPYSSIFSLLFSPLGCGKYTCVNLS